MIKRLLAAASFFLLAIPSLAAAQGVTSSADPRATEAGREILHQGGSAADAAVAMVAVLTLVEPQSSGIGGGGFMVYHNAGDGSISTIDGRETAPAAAKPDRFLGPDGKPRGYMDVIPGGLSVGVPGNVRLMEMAHKKWGKLEWKALFQPAIKLAEEGYQVTPALNSWLVQFEPMWKEFPAARAIYYVDGKPAPVGTTIKNPAYAAILRDIAARGPEAFYTGANAKAISDAVAKAPRNPSQLTLKDLAAYKAKERPAVCTTYRIYKVCGMGPPSSGATTVFGILGMLEAYDMKAMGKDNPMSWHLLAEAMQLAYADRAAYLGDSDFVDVPVKGLLDKAYLAERRQLISPFGAAGRYEPGAPPGAKPRAEAPPVKEQGTTHFVAVDAAGNVVSMTSTVESIFGSQLMANGYFLNNELTDFDLAPAKDGIPTQNRVQAGKRPLSSMSPTIVYGPDGKVVLAVGSAGGKRIIMHVTKTLIGVLDWGLDAKSAMELPNLYFGQRGVVIENNAAGQAIAAKMKPFGYSFTATDLGSKLNAVERTDKGWQGAADPRGPGTSAVDGAPPQG
ncbi:MULTISPECIES: gamma-glutamyltransferase [unclassified Sphingopyxis]|uniref:gamma-glutamyltransferase n=1 Tax=unclassified Sphingopyxis TaxID=2614943 RepID=UPI000730868B|nr:MULTISPECIES: gamma-glutamyltransferase [unclassified Sphingopyxis]KTE26516.1 gamma-glutamyltranspeptidase [Sphingopyxis sp. H057]KTE52922.1 gamma-glutamyltranspeptidase [Sphingopyxis sp. H073]KTE55111.1 gamma-glutamyltranspeptidase [Sphingopyxis sp. H071]KTE59334.1 gamma-glutamyltranspeptidase [Sphingopyxis sp. H107]KTE64134.1 gamma-glutamyltranspeptidase [Sphingopyxis sp. H100]